LNSLKEIILTLFYRLNTFVAMTPKEHYLDLLGWNPILIDSSYDRHIASFIGIKLLTIYRIKKEISKPIKGCVFNLSFVLCSPILGRIFI